MRLWIWIKEHWLGSIGSAVSLWSTIRWVFQKLLETSEHAEFLANHLRDLPLIGQMIENWPALPPWAGTPALGIGFFLIWLDWRRTKAKIANKQVTVQKPSKIEICFKSSAPYEASDIAHGRVLSTVRIGVKNSGGSPLSNCKVYIESVSPPPAHAGMFPAMLDNGSFALRHDDPEKLIDVATYWEHAGKYRFSTPLGGYLSEKSLDYIDGNEPRTFVIKAVATECTKSAVFKILVDESKTLRLKYIGDAN
jgi:hypothetical protein